MNGTRTLVWDKTDLKHPVIPKAIRVGKSCQKDLGTVQGNILLTKIFKKREQWGASIVDQQVTSVLDEWSKLSIKNYQIDDQPYTSFCVIQVCSTLQQGHDSWSIESSYWPMSLLQKRWEDLTSPLPESIWESNVCMQFSLNISGIPGI